MDKCTILGVHIAVTDMSETVSFLEDNILNLSGKYICVSNVHTCVTAYEDEAYKNIQNSAVLALPDGAPLSIVSRKRGYEAAQRVTGPDLMGVLFQHGNEGNGLRHFFYGGTEETLEQLKKELQLKYPSLQVVGLYSPPFRPLTKEEDKQVIEMINDAKPDIVWIGLGAPKQERWMYEHQNKIHGVMLGVGAGFDYHAGKIKRAPIWMQKMSLEWLARLIQNPKRLWKRYLTTNTKFLWYTWKEYRAIGK